MNVKHGQHIWCGCILIVAMLFAGLAAWAETIQYSYDTMYRLTQAGYEDGTAVDYTYDKMGNRLQEVVTASGCAHRTVCNGDFEQGFAFWVSTDNAAIVSGRSGQGVQVEQDGANGDIIQRLPGVFEGRRSYRATAWCLADVGKQCRLFFGDSNLEYGPIYEHFATQSLAGTGDWQQLEVMVTLTHEELMNIFLYAPLGPAIYDDVQVEEVSEDLVASYPFSEGTGTTTADVSGNGYDGTLLNGVSWTTDGKEGTALSFDGVDDYVEVNSGIVPTHLMTVAAWIKKASGTDGHDLIVSGEGTGAMITYYLGEYVGIGDGSLSFGIYDSATGAWKVAQSGITITDTQWHHVVGVSDGTQTQIYLDGALQGTGETGSLYTTFKTDIGRSPYGGGGAYFSGLIDEVTIYDRALSASEIQALTGVIGDDPVASYPFSEGSGTATADASGNGYDGTLLNGVAWTTNGKVGNALSFDGVDDYVEVNSGIVSTHLMTVAAWIKKASGTDGHDLIVSGEGTGAMITYCLGEYVGLGDGSLLFGIYDSATGTWKVAQSGISITDTQWHHVVGVSDGTQTQIYLDGALQGTGETGSLYTTLKTDIGRSPYGGGGAYFSGLIDEVTIYDRALSASEIQALAGVIGDDPVASYPFSEGSGTTTADASGNGYDGTLLNGVSWTTDGKVGNALSFDGSDDYVEVNSGIVSTHLMTVAAWIKKASGTDGHDLIASGEGTGAMITYCLGEYVGLGDGSLLFGIYDSATGTWKVAQSGISITDTQWHHVVGVSDGTQTQIYLDGALQGTGETGSLYTTFKTDIGRSPYGGGGAYFFGLIDEVTIYDRALSASEIQTLAGVIGDDPVASYPFSEGSGTTTADASGNGYDGTLLNGVSWITEGKVGNALSFDGVDDYVEVNSGIVSTHLMTVAAWIKKASGTDGHDLIVSGEGTGAMITYCLGEYVGLGDGSLLFGIYDSATGTWKVAQSGISITDTQWHHVVGVSDGTQTQIYLDGALQGTGETGSLYTTLKTDIGRSPYGGGGAYFSGLIDEVTIYDRALSASEIQVLAGVGGSATFAATSFSESTASLSTSVDDLVEVDGSSISINVGASPDLNYGIGDFTVVVTARTADASSAREGTPPWSPSTSLRTGSSREEFTGSVSHVAVGVRQGKELFLYLDGALQAQKNVGDGRITRLNVNVGLDDVSTNAVIEDVKLFPSALSPEEITGLSSESELK